MVHPRSWRLIASSLAALCLLEFVPPRQVAAQSEKGKGGETKATPSKGKGASPRAESADPSSPGGILKARKLRRSMSTYVVSGESDVQKKLSGARAQLSQFRQAAAQQRSFELGIRDRKVFEQQIVEQRTMLNQQIAELDQQMPSLDLARNNEAVNNFRNDLIEQKNRLILISNQMNDRLRLIDRQGDDSEFKQRVDQEVARYREAYMQSIVDARQLIDETRKSYEELAKDADVTRAIQAINDGSKTKVKLGPSREFLANVTAFEKVEKSVLTEKVELRKQNGVYFVDVTFNGKVTRPMVFDTGAGISTLSSALAAEIGLRPKPSDPTIKCQTADGSIVEAKQMTVGSMRVGKFTIKDVVCAVMPADKGDVEPLLGQTFHRHFTYQFTPESGRLILTQVDEGDSGTRSNPGPSRVKGGRGTSKTKRSTRPQSRGNPDPTFDEIPSDN